MHVLTNPIPVRNHQKLQKKSTSNTYSCNDVGQKLPFFLDHEFFFLNAISGDLEFWLHVFCEFWNRYGLFIYCVFVFAFIASPYHLKNSNALCEADWSRRFTVPSLRDVQFRWLLKTVHNHFFLWCIMILQGIRHRLWDGCIIRRKLLHVIYI